MSSRRFSSSSPQVAPRAFLIVRVDASPPVVSSRRLSLLPRSRHLLPVDDSLTSSHQSRPRAQPPRATSAPPPRAPASPAAPRSPFARLAARRRSPPRPPPPRLRSSRALAVTHDSPVFRRVRRLQRLELVVGHLCGDPRHRRSPCPCCVAGLGRFRRFAPTLGLGLGLGLEVEVEVVFEVVVGMRGSHAEDPGRRRGGRGGAARAGRRRDVARRAGPPPTRPAAKSRPASGGTGGGTGTGTLRLELGGFCERPVSAGRDRTARSPWSARSARVGPRARRDAARRVRRWR